MTRPRDRSRIPRHRLRVAVHAAHRQAHTRGERLLRDPPPDALGGVGAAVVARRDHPLRAARRRCTTKTCPASRPASSVSTFPSSASATACSSSPCTRAAPWSPVGASTGGPTCASVTPTSCTALNAGEDIAVWCSHGDHVDAPPPGFETIAATRDLARRGLPVAVACPVRRPVPPRGRPHPAWRRDHRQLSLPHLRVPPRLDRGRLRGRLGRAHPQPGRIRRGPCAASRAASIRRWRRRWSTGRSATG